MLIAARDRAVELSGVFFVRLNNEKATEKDLLADAASGGLAHERVWS
jgi:hypothetical protein